MADFVRWCASIALTVVGYSVMPAGPWYRQVGAAMLIIISTRILPASLPGAPPHAG